MSIPTTVYDPLPGEVRMKEFIANETERTHLSASSISKRVCSGKYTNLIIRRVNRSVVFVKVNGNDNSGENC